MLTLKTTKWYGNVVHPGQAKEVQDEFVIHFESVTQMRNFINSKQMCFYSENFYQFDPNQVSKNSRIFFKIVKVLKIKHSQIIAKLEKTTLREINLDILTQ